LGRSFELKRDGFRALVSTEGGLAVRSRRGWNMTAVLPELRALPSGLVLDGDLGAWKGASLSRLSRAFESSPTPSPSVPNQKVLGVEVAH
jgi:ATP-dependent DNA ligase